MPSEERQAVEAWAAGQEDKLTLSKAIRRLVKLALETEAQRTAKPKSRSRKD